MIFLTPSIIQLQVVGKSTNEFTSAAPSGGKLTLSDHSRSALSISYEIIENSQRMANGTMRKSIISKKKSFSCSWEMLPTVETHVVDNNAHALSMRDFYEKYCFLPMTLTLRHKKNGVVSPTYETYQVYWSGFNYDVIKRYNNFDYWNISADFTEI